MPQISLSSLTWIQNWGHRQMWWGRRWWHYWEWMTLLRVDELSAGWVALFNNVQGWDKASSVSVWGSEELGKGDADNRFEEGAVTAVSATVAEATTLRWEVSSKSPAFSAISLEVGMILHAGRVGMAVIAHKLQQIRALLSVNKEMANTGWITEFYHSQNLSIVYNKRHFLPTIFQYEMFW